MSLTDDWNAGKLDVGQYYVAYKGGRYGIENLIETYDYYGFDNNWANIIVEVLAPVPSYEELQEMKEKAQKYDDIKNVCLENKALELKAERLRDLLKECRCMLLSPFIRAEYPNGDVITRTQLIDSLVTRINAAISESEEK